jgi:hypothetical protein
MAKANSRISCNSQSVHAKGAALAVKMLRYLERNGGSTADSCGLDPRYRTAGVPQRNIVLEYLNAAPNNPEAVAGFASVLSDYIAGCADGAVPDADCYKVGREGASHD